MGRGLASHGKPPKENPPSREWAGCFEQSEPLKLHIT
jgi:hypothetical protein